MHEGNLDALGSEAQVVGGGDADAPLEVVGQLGDEDGRAAAHTPGPRVEYTASLTRAKYER